MLFLIFCNICAVTEVHTHVQVIHVQVIHETEAQASNYPKHSSFR